MLAEPSLKDSELRYRRLFEATQDGILILNAETGMIDDVNPYLMKMLGYSREEFVKKKLWEVGAFRDIEASKAAFEGLQDKEYIRYEDLPLMTKDGRLIQVEFVSNVYLVGGEKIIQCNIRDITEHRRIIIEYRRIITALEGNENKYHDLINQSPDGYFTIELSGNILTVNKAMCKELEFSEEEFLSMHIWDIIPDPFLQQYRERLTKILKGESLKESMEYIVLGKHGSIHYVEVLSAPRYNGKELIGFQGIARDITARKQSEQALQESERRHRTLVEHLPTVVYTNALDDTGSTLYVSPQIEALVGYTPQEWLADPKLWLKRLHPEDRQHVLAQAAHIDRHSKPFEMDYRMIARDGGLVWVHDQVVLVHDLDGSPQFWQGIMLDITERKQAEEALRASEERLSQVWEATSDAMGLSDPDGIMLAANPAYLELYGYTREQVVGKSFSSIFPEEFREQAVQQYRKVFASEAIAPGFESAIQRSDGTGRFVEANATFLTTNGRRTAMLSTIRDITIRKQAEKKIHQQLQHLTALRTIDQAIAANFDLKLSLSEILTHVTTELGVDAAAILLLNSSSQMLEYGAQGGFRSRAVKKLPMRLSSSYAGRVVLERKSIQVQNPGDGQENLFLGTPLEGEDFVFYYGVPLITKGQVKGVLEVFHRTAFEPDAEWLNFLHNLASQAAIAIENATLFEGLQRSHLELSLAYDATIEGWSRALDLRDKETEGHTLRVTEMTQKLARAFGVPESELMQIRWGSLLHDIGKMAVPDGILFKTASLSDEEWVMMKKHPVFAYEMLAPIRYLQQSLDIPYCHHEKWDGTGYPRGLKGEMIPLSARIFAVVDVWDALCSDRPYRAGWPEEKVRANIRALSGTHFDPQVVDAFMQSLN